MEAKIFMRDLFNSSPIDWFIKGVGTNIASKLFWRFVPGVEFKLRWPRGWTEPTADGVQTESADPNAHYRPWFERHVGKQCISWDWTVKESDLTGNTLTVKIRRGRAKYASMAIMKWG
jgi:hypothetical protein